MDKKLAKLLLRMHKLYLGYTSLAVGWPLSGDKELKLESDRIEDELQSADKEDVMDKELGELLLRMHKLNGVIVGLLKTANAFQDVNVGQESLEFNKIEDELQSIINGGYSNEKETVLLMVEEREFEQRCLKVELCPKCGKGLGRDHEDPCVKACFACNLAFPHLQ